MAGYNNPQPNMAPQTFQGRNSKIAGLNAMPSEYQMPLAPQPQPPQQAPDVFSSNGQYDFQADLDMFTNTQFFDFDMADMTDNNSPNGAQNMDSWGMGPSFIGDRQQQIASFNAYNTAPNQQQQQPCIPQYPAGTATSTPTSASSSENDGKSRNASTTAALRSTNPTTITTSSNNPNPLADSDGNIHLDEDSRAAAEEDKRRRNTAASARFRVKKKQREQALEKTAKDMTDKVSLLEARCENLQRENQLLKDLITERSKGDGNVVEAREAVRERERLAASSNGVGNGAKRRGDVKDEVGLS